MEDWNISGLPKAHPYQLIDFLQHVESERGDSVTVAELLDAFAQALYEQMEEE